ncbi:hypothetical protein GT347_01775 [Xylophilus rhododendri]|uniref:Uncharacterized protein n=1 Tax=Xylophilus rhododendri TaxID=2697032 RepID=A0A857J0W9_9BURK|nr:hypothetical protein [Xylophilus rhododendri]QHI96829.1 hypothetical protein GT347_01775 [Xylophilus rhododendri]
MNKLNALNPGASSTAQAIRNAEAGRSTTGEPDGSQAYENSTPGTIGNVPGEHKTPPGARVTASMMGTSKTKEEAGVPQVKKPDADKPT